MMNEPAIRFVNVSRYFGEVRAVDEVNLEIDDGEFFTMLGPSGSGKTTCLRMIAGFEQVSKGQIFLHGRDVSNLPPYERDVNTVFQDYALFPHMTVGENVGYGLMIRKVPRPEREQQVSEMLDLVRLPGLAGRKPAQLSGGQRQRVALARALINHPRVLLLDEPLGALDLKLRQQMQIELKTIQQKVGITFIYVTHDQEEALTMSDRMAVFNQGKIEQVGTPAGVYERPATPFVAGFVGVSNLLNSETAGRLLHLNQMVAIRPEKIRMVEPQTAVPKGYHMADGLVREVVYLGMYTRYQVELLGGGELSVAQQNLEASIRWVRGRPVRLLWSNEDTRPVSE